MRKSIIAEERKKLGLSQEELADKLNISQKSVSKYELFDRRPSYETLFDMASLFNISIEDILLNFLSESDYINREMNTHQMPEITHINKNQQFSTDEESLLQAFAQCSDECRQYLIAKAHVLSVEGISAVAGNEYGKYIDEEKKSHPSDGITKTGT